jgi:hypothetical protein
MTQNAGLYVILVVDSTWNPRHFRALYFGETGSYASRVCRDHEKYQSWVKASGGGLLFVAFHLIADESERQHVEKLLIADYSPECNKTHNTLASLLGY